MGKQLMIQVKINKPMDSSLMEYGDRSTTKQTEKHIMFPDPFIKLDWNFLAIVFHIIYMYILATILHELHNICG